MNDIVIIIVGSSSRVKSKKEKSKIIILSYNWCSYHSNSRKRAIIWCRGDKKVKSNSVKRKKQLTEKGALLETKNTK